MLFDLGGPTNAMLKLPKSAKVGSEWDPYDDPHYSPDSNFTASGGLTNMLQLPDGRYFADAEYGRKSADHTITHLHGMPSTRLSLASSTSLHRSCRIICPDRPSYSFSTHDPRRTIESFTKDIQHLVDHSGLDEFFVVGTSGGGLYSHRCTRWMDLSRLKGVVCIVGASPGNMGD